MATFLMALSVVCLFGAFYFFLCLFIPKLPFVQSRARAAFLLGLSFVGMIGFSAAGTALMSPEQRAELAEQGGQAEPTEGAQGLLYEVVGNRMLNDARILQVATAAPVAALREIADSLMAKDEFRNEFVIRVFFFFPDEEAGEILPRYRVEKSAEGVKVFDLTDGRKIAGLRIE